MANITCKGRIEVSLVAIALVLFFAIGPTGAFGQQNQNTDQSYGNPGYVFQYNKTDVTPSGQMEQVIANESYMFNYRNMTLVLNCTRNCEINVTLDPTLKPKTLSLSIEPNQNMSLAINMSGIPPKAEMVQTQSLNFYLGLEANATLQLTAQIRLHINQTALSQELNREINASRLTWQYYNLNEHEWVTVPSWIQNNYLTCNTTHFSSWTITQLGAAPGESYGSGNYSEIPGAPGEAMQYNKTSTTPSGETHQVQSGEPTLFQYRNMTMLMNCTQNCSVTLTADPNLTPKTLGLSVEPIQNMSLALNMSRSPLEGAQIMERSLNFYLGIESNAEVSLQAQIKLLINQTQLNQELSRVVNASNLTWLCWNRTQEQWKPVDSFMDQNGYLVCNTTHFSLWTVAEAEGQTIPQPVTSTTESDSPTQTPATYSSVSPSAAPTPTAQPTTTDTTIQEGLPSQFVYLGVTGALIAALAVVVLAVKRRKP